MASTLAIALIISLSFGCSDASRTDAQQMKMLMEQESTLKQQLEENQRHVSSLREESSTVQSVGPPLPKRGGGNDKNFYCCQIADGEQWGWLQLKPATDIRVKTFEQEALAKVKLIPGVNIPAFREAAGGEYTLPNLEDGSVADGKRGWWVQAIAIAVEFKPKSMAGPWGNCNKLTKNSNNIIKTATQKTNALLDLQGIKDGLPRLVKIVGEITVLMKDDGHLVLIDAAPAIGAGTGGEELLNTAKIGLEKCIQELKSP